MTRLARRAAIGTVCVMASLLLSACGGDDPKPAGPDVRGLVLPDAEAMLKAAHIGYSEHAKDALLGIVIKEHFIVCTEAYVNKHFVRLEVAKNGC